MIHPIFQWTEVHFHPMERNFIIAGIMPGLAIKTPRYRYIGMTVLSGSAQRHWSGNFMHRLLHPEATRFTLLEEEKGVYRRFIVLPKAGAALKHTLTEVTGCMILCQHAAATCTPPATSMGV